METRFKIYAIIGVTACLFIALIMSAPTKYQIEKCQQTTGWSEERCLNELNR